MTSATMERFFVTVGNKQGVSNAIALVVTTLFSASLLWLDLLAKLPVESQAPWAIGAGVPVWFLTSGALDAIGASFTTDKERQEHSGTRCVVGVAKAIAALLLLIGGAVVLWLI